MEINMSGPVMDWFMNHQSVAKKYVDALGYAGDNPVLFIPGLCKAYDLSESMLPGKGRLFLEKLVELAGTNDQTKILETARGIVQGAAIMPGEEEEPKKSTPSTAAQSSGGGGCLTVVLIIVAFTASCIVTMA